MKVNWVFSIYPGPRPLVPVPYSPYIEDPVLYQRLYELIEPTWEGQYSRPNRPGHPSSSVRIDLPDGHSRLHQAIEMLRQAGWEPLLTEGFDQRLKDTHYLIRRIRHYDTKDYKSAEYFHITHWCDRTFIAEYSSMHDDHLVCRVTKAKWKTRYGYAMKRLFYPRLVNDELKEALESADLHGLSFRPVLFDRPEKAKGSFWCVYSSLSMPRCLVPMYETEVTGENGNVKVRLYDDAGHYPVELVYGRQAIEAMEPFDAALASPEELGHPDQQPWERPLIVSARCRKVMLSQLRMTSVKFVPVRLISK